MQDKTVPTTLPSITALSVAAAFHRALDTKYGYLFTKEELLLIQHFVYTAIEMYPSSFNGTLMKTISVLPYSWQQGFFNRAVIPAYDEIIMLRKFMIRYKLEEAIANGAKQVVIIGGGYDTLSMIMAEKYPDVMFYEIDKGATRQCKLDAIKTMPEDLPGKGRINKNLLFIEADLNETPLFEVLNSSIFDSSKRTFFLAEGLTCYLNKKSNQELLYSINYLCKHDDSELLISYITKMGYYSGITEAAHTESSEQYQFSLPASEVLSFAADCVFDIVAKKSATDMLEALGKKNSAEFYNNNQDIREYYYVLKNQTGLLDTKKGIADVPDIKIELPPKPLEQVSSCLLM